MNQPVEEILKAYANRLWNEHDLSAIEEFSHPDGVVHEFPQATERFSLPIIRSRVARILQAMPDHSMEIGRMISSNDAVFWTWRIRGTWHFSENDGRPIDINGASLYFFEGGKIVRRTGESEALKLDYQLGRVNREINIQFPL